MREKPENAGRDHAGRWVKGVSGNPEGKPRGTRHRTTLAIEDLLEGEAEILTRKAIELAKNGETAALRLCLERIIPPRRETTVEVDLPPLESAADLPRACAALLQSVATGDLTIGEAERLARILADCARAFEVHEIHERLRALEERDEG